MLKKLLTIIALAISSFSFSQKLSSKNIHTFHICPNGVVQGWGNNSMGQLGNGSNNGTFLPKAVVGLNGTVTKVATGTNHTLFLKSDGTVWACGDNSKGQLGTGNNNRSYVPVQVAISGSVTAIAAGNASSFFIKSDGTAWACGWNSDGELGTGNYNDYNTPVQVNISGTVTAVSAGVAHSLFLKSDGYAWACGSNQWGALGNQFLVAVGGRTNTPVQVFSFPQITAISAGMSHSLFLKSDGSVWSCGQNENGQLGLGDFENRGIPFKITSLTGSVSAIEAGTANSLFLKNDGTVLGCGHSYGNEYGSLYITEKPLVINIPGGNVTEIATGYSHCLFLKNDGTIWGFGYNNSGQLGIGSNRVFEGILVEAQSLCLPPPTTPPTAVVNTPTSNAVCKGADVYVNTTALGSNPDVQTSIDNSINLNNPIAIDKNSTGVFVLNNNSSITKYNFNGSVASTYPNLSHTNIWAFTVDESNNIYLNNGSTDGSGNPVYIKCDATGATIDSIPNGFMGNPNYVTDMLFLDNPPNLENLFVADSANGNAAINATNMNDNNAFTNSIQFNLYNNRITSLSYDNFYPEKRLLVADPINHVLESHKMFNNMGDAPVAVVDSALTAGMALDFISADTTFKMIAVSSRATGILGIASSFRLPDGSVIRSIDTTLTSKVNAVTPVGMVLVKNGNKLEYWIADNGQNKLLRLSLGSYQITPTLPAGLVFNSVSGAIEGTPTTITAPQTYTLTTFSLLGSTSSTFTLGVNPSSGASNTTGTYTSSTNQADGTKITYTDGGNCTKLAVITDFVGGTSPGYTQVNQTVNTGSMVTVGNKNFLRRVTSVKAQQKENLNASITISFTYSDVAMYNAANPSTTLSNDTTGGNMQIASLHMHDTINAAASQLGKKPIITSPLYAMWKTDLQQWEVGIPVTQLSDFYIGHPSIATGFDCTNTGKDTLVANDYYVWNNYDTLFTSGDYIDTLVNRTGCDSVAHLHLTINITTGLSESVNGLGINIYPNPNNGLFNLHFSTTTIEPTRVRVLNILGTEVYTKTVSSSSIIDIQNLDSGIYFVMIDYKDKPIVWRIVKQN